MEWLKRALAELEQNKVVLERATSALQEALNILNPVDYTVWEEAIKEVKALPEPAKVPLPVRIVETILRNDNSMTMRELLEQLQAQGWTSKSKHPSAVLTTELRKLRIKGVLAAAGKRGNLHWRLTKAARAEGDGRTKAEKKLAKAKKMLGKVEVK